MSAGVVVLAAGQWSRELARMVGATLPIVSIPHHYVITEAVDGLQAGDDTLPVLRDPDASFYARQDNEGLVVGPFEREIEPWALGGIPKGFHNRLLKPELARIMPCLEAAAGRIPVLAETPIKKPINGPDGYTPDGRCLMGPVPGLKDFFVLSGFSIFGIVWSGGAGRYTAEWIVDGQPSDNMWEVDVRRFGDYAGTAYTARAGDRRVRARVRHPLSRRGAARCPPAEDRAAVRPTRCARRRDRGALRLGAPALVREARRADRGRLLLPARQLARDGRRGVPGSPLRRRRARPDELRQVRDLGARCGTRSSTGSVRTDFPRRSDASA